MILFIACRADSIMNWSPDDNHAMLHIAIGVAYKGTLAEHIGMLIWGATRKKRVKITIIESLRSAKKLVQEYRG